MDKITKRADYQQIMAMKSINENDKFNIDFIISSKKKLDCHHLPEDDVKEESYLEESFK